MVMLVIPVLGREGGADPYYWLVSQPFLISELQVSVRD